LSGNGAGANGVSGVTGLETWLLGSPVGVLTALNGPPGLPQKLSVAGNVAVRGEKIPNASALWTMLFSAIVTLEASSLWIPTVMPCRLVSKVL
jgi:hypothetical protein